VLAGALFWRALLAGLLGLSALVPNLGQEQLLRNCEVGLLAVMALGAGRAGFPRARRAFWASLAAVALGLGLDALTPSYDAGAGWDRASLLVEAASAIALLYGLFLLGRFLAALVALGMVLGIAARHVDLEIPFWAAGWILSALGYFLIARRVRAQPLTRSEPAPDKGLFRWSVIEIVRFALAATFMMIWVDGRGELRPLLTSMLIVFAILTLFGLRFLARFLNALQMGDAPLAWGTVTLVASLLPLFPVAESYLTERVTALEYIRFAGLTGLFAWIGGALSTLLLLARAKKSRLARWLHRALSIDLLILLAAGATDLFGGWTARDYARVIEPFAALALLAFWLLYLILQVVAGVKACASTT
jgi:putative Mn2+ efflux pump MntP